MVLILIAGAAAAAAVNLDIILTAQKYIITPQEASSLGADAVLVLGASVYPDHTPSPMLRDRIDTGVAVYKAGAAPKIIMSGDHGTSSYDEVSTMKIYAEKDGVSGSVIFMDHAGLSTYDSMYRAKNIFGVKKIVISTQRYHLYRAIYTARRLGIEAWGVDAALHTYTTEVYDNCREFLARVKAFGMCIYKPASVYTGEPIDLSGDGSITDDNSYAKIYDELMTTD